jgi:hypothetical protein
MSYAYDTSPDIGVQLNGDHERVPGDANADGTVNFADLLILAQHYGLKNQNYMTGDFNGDFSVGFDDLLFLAQHYGQTSAAATSPAPEPSALTALGLLAIAITARRRRRCVSDHSH